MFDELNTEEEINLRDILEMADCDGENGRKRRILTPSKIWIILERIKLM